MKKLYLFLIPILFVAAMPLANISGLTPHNEPIWVIPEASRRFVKVSEIFQDKCVDCHSPGMTRYPFYADFPIARQLMADDIKNASSRFMMTEQHYSGDAAFDPVTLARLEGSIRNDSMPPALYLSMHWTGSLNRSEKSEILAWIAEERAKHQWSEEAAPERKGEPIQPLPVNSALDTEKVELGRELFHEYALSGDGTLNCASCHDIDKGGTDHSRTATGIRGQKGPINSPTVFNTGYNIAQFWDGRAADLYEQAAGPVANPMEMGADWNEVVAKLKQNDRYQEAFERLYPEQELSQSTVIDAIVTYELSLVTANSRFDQYLRGDSNALNGKERLGYELFKQHCASCHSGPALGGLSFEKMGAAEDYFKLRGRKPTEVDNGRYNVTKREEDRHYFKVPTLRNVEFTYPYFHDGTVNSLEEAVDIMARVQRGVKLKQGEIDDIVAFLKTLTGEYQGIPVTQLGATSQGK